jgi:light-regulated signal transduction histidine kinase (bacteriophytochrome)
LNIQPVPEGIFILSVDVTEKRRQEEELRIHREHLEELVTHRTAQLDAVNKELEAFSYSVSHDLRAPLRHIHGFVNLLAKGTSDNLDEKNRSYLEVIRQSAERMGKLIDDLLSFSRASRAGLVKLPLDMKRAFSEVINEMSPEVQGRNVDWQVDEMPEVEADPALLRLVIINLISNALKYTRTREQARIHASWLPGNDGEVIFFVQDNGVGFDMKYQDKLFGVFQRLHRVEEFEGTGIGLANVRRIIQRHGGRTWAEGQVGSGATFYFSLPSGKDT